MKSRRPHTKKYIIQNTQFLSITNDFATNKQIPNNAKLLFIYLKAQSQNYNISNNTIEKEMNLSKKTILKAKNDLINLGYLNIYYDKTEKAYIYELIDTPNKPKPKPTKESKQESINLLKYALKKAKENAETQTNKQAISSIEKTLIDLINKEAE